MSRFEKKKSNRSDHYQWQILEVPCSDEWMSQFNNSQSYQGYLNPFQYDERYFELQDRLKERARELMELHLTPRQKQIIDLYCEGYTQAEVADILGCNQSSITKSLNGNKDYKQGGKIYGGSQKKLRKIFLNDPLINEILAELKEVTEDRL